MLVFVLQSFILQLGNSDHVVSLSIDFPSYLQWGVLLHHIPY